MSPSNRRVPTEDSRSTRKHLLVSSILVSSCRFLVVLGEFIGLVLIGSRFGARLETDAYLAARFVPVGLVSALAGAFGLTFIPVYSRTRTELGEAVGAHLAGGFVDVVQLASLVITLCYVALADWAVAVLVPGLSPEGQHLAVTLTRIMAACFLLGNLYTALDSVLNAHHRYVASAFASLWMPIGTLVGILVLAGFWGIQGVAFGVLGGAVLRLATVLPATRSLVPCRILRVRLDARQLWETLSGLGLALLIFGVGHISAWIPRMFASWLGQGAIAVFTFGVLPVLVLPSLVALSIHKVLYPEIVLLIAEGDDRQLSNSYCRGIALVAFIAFPITAGLVALSGPITRLAFQYGQVDATSCLRMAEVMAWASLGLFPSIVGMMLSGYLFARGNTGLVLSLTSLMLIVITATDYAMMTWMGLAGLGLATAAVSMIRFSLLVTAIRLFRPEIHLASVAWPVFKLAVAALTAAAVVSWTDGYVSKFATGHTVINQLMILTVLGFVGTAAYLGMICLLHGQQKLTWWSVLAGHANERGGSRQ